MGLVALEGLPGLSFLSPRVVLPDGALCLPTVCHLLYAVNKTSSSSSSSKKSR